MHYISNSKPNLEPLLLQNMVSTVIDKQVGVSYLGVQGNHWKAIQMDVHQCPRWCTPAPFQTKGFGPPPSA